MTSHKPLPSNPDLRIFRNRVQSLVNAHASQDDGTSLSVADARHTVAREYGFDDWDALRTEIEPASTYTARAEAHKAALPPDHEFFKAVGARDLDRVRELLDQDPSLANADVRGNASIQGHWGWGASWGDPAEWETVRAVHFAAFTHGDLLRLLIKYGADVDAYGCNGTPLVLACWEGSRETVQILLEAGANPNLPNIHGGSPLHSAINHWDPWKIEILLRYGARHDIFSAAIVGDLEEVKRLLNDGEYLINRRDIVRDRTPLEWAAFRRQEEVGEYLIEKGAEVTPQAIICLGMLDEIKKCVEDDPEFANRPIGAEWSDPPLLWAVQVRSDRGPKVPALRGRRPRLQGRVGPDAPNASSGPPRRDLSGGSQGAHRGRSRCQRRMAMADAPRRVRHHGETGRERNSLSGTARTSTRRPSVGRLHFRR